MPTVITLSAIDTAVARLDAWLETMRGADGYGGPVAHWWQQSLIYTGAGLDWRYEGIIAGYLELWRRTGNKQWLEKACVAGNDLLAGQLEDDHFAASCFEINPASAGTPHEAGCDVGLLLLALELRKQGREDWAQYASSAERNLRSFYLRKLWDEKAHAFRDSPAIPSFVPNKAATACEALFLLAELTGDEELIERYALPTLDAILSHQVSDRGNLDGAVAQNSFGPNVVAKYFPIYIARCIPALLHGYRWSSDERYQDGALRAMNFIGRWMGEDGTLPTVVYPNLRINRYPSWVAPLGDVLRVAELMRTYGFDANLALMERRLLDGQDSSGGIQTARGFAAQAGGKLPDLYDLRDLLHVPGWCDKSFRHLASKVGLELDAIPSSAMTFEAECIFQGQRLRFKETPDLIEVTGKTGVAYRWRKGQPWPEIATAEFWLR